MKTENLTWEEVKALPDRIKLIVGDSKECSFYRNGPYRSFRIGEKGLTPDDMYWYMVQDSYRVHPDSIPDLEKWYKEQEDKCSCHTHEQTLYMCGNCEEKLGDSIDLFRNRVSQNTNKPSCGCNDCHAKTYHESKPAESDPQPFGKFIHDFIDRVCETAAHPDTLKKLESYKPNNQECEHDWISFSCSETGREGVFCRTCSIVYFVDDPGYPYHSGKDALDKLMRGECDRIVLDNPEWIKFNRNIRISSEEYLDSTLYKEYYLQTKWLCLKDGE